MILTGIPGIGKTTTLLCIARKLYGKYMNDTVLELNASDERGIKLINSGELNNFCNQKLPYSSTEQKNYANHKLIIFDEADNMTEKALPIISILMDKFHNTTRFVFTCNTSSKIIESIQSRCKILRFSRLQSSYVTKRLIDICKLENVKYKTNGIEEIAIISNGDLRSGINLLQLTHDKYDIVNLDNVSKACDKPSAVLIKNIIVDCINKKLKDAIKNAFILKSNGFTGVDIIYNSFNVMKLHICNDIQEDVKIKVLSVISDYMFSISKTMDTDVQLSSFLIELCEIK